MRLTPKALAVINTASFAGMIIMNFLANFLPLNEKNTGELSDQYPNLFVPAGFTFAIWGLIYLWLAIFIVYQGVKTLSPGDSTEFPARIGWRFAISSLANMSWIIAWHYEYVALSLLLMVALLISLISIYEQLDVAGAGQSYARRLLVNAPFSIYLGWITVATIANVTALLVKYEWNGWGFSDQFWAAAMITVAVLLGVFILLKRYDVFFIFTLIWALYGIYSKRMDDPSEASRVVLYAAHSGMILLGIGVVYILLKGTWLTGKPIKS